ncbi:ribonuclease BN [Streptomyces sp. Alain-F2R5]|uniref:YihY/virulence factor BrkB family protein n=1 Tax=Streptomyces mutabilis TaxID=67332 RepID=UPI000BC4AB45|nr:YihY/virulence factor BrkB family protein [Streptomyces sp. Alain-F2R5]MDG9694918.1 YihY/virulence factor BrkB family protein [Streptomyces sp. DH17]PAN01120.1 ribonuclease BN [Streptomyces sp. Alain-F2R5]
MTALPEARPARLRDRLRPWTGALRRVPRAMWDDNVSDWAAALTYYAVLALVPALVVTVSVIGLVAPGMTDRLIDDVTSWAPAQSGAELHRALHEMAGQRSAALAVAVAGAVGALWSATSYLAVFRRALHDMHRVPDRRPLWYRLHRIVLTALSLLGLLVASALVLLLTGPLARALGRWAGLGSTATTAWSVLRWPLLLSLVALLVLVLFRTGPVAARRSRQALPGGALAALLWLASSAAFSLYASGIGTYGRLYGSLAGVVVFLVWLWVSHLSLLAGARFTAELSRAV